MQRVEFPTLSPFLPRDVPVERSSGRIAACRAELYTPDDAPGRRPAVVIVEGLGGLKRSRERKYGEKLARLGYVALVIDSFGTRGVAWLPDNVRGLIVTETMLCADAYAGLHFLGTHPMVDSAKVFVLGFSYGGMIAVMTAYRQIRDLFAAPDTRFAGHVSYYGCSIPRFDNPQTTGSPVLVLVGARDRNVDIERARHIAGDLVRGGSQVQFEVLPDAFHQWDTNHRTKKLILFSLNRVRIRVTPENEILNEDTGAPIRGALSRFWAIVRGASPSGFHMLRDEAALRRSDQLLRSFLG